jgi:hypothetical protein
MKNMYSLSVIISLFFLSGCSFSLFGDDSDLGNNVEITQDNKKPKKTLGKKLFGWFPGYKSKSEILAERAEKAKSDALKKKLSALQKMKNNQDADKNFMRGVLRMAVYLSSFLFGLGLVVFAVGFKIPSAGEFAIPLLIIGGCGFFIAGATLVFFDILMWIFFAIVLIFIGTMLYFVFKNRLLSKVAKGAVETVENLKVLEPKLKDKLKEVTDHIDTKTELEIKKLRSKISAEKDRVETKVKKEKERLETKLSSERGILESKLKEAKDKLKEIVD